MAFVDRDIRVGVGGVVLRGDEVLLVKMNYGGSKGRWMIPGGLLEPNETIDETVEREVYEETQVKARAKNIVGVRSAWFQNDKNDTYIVYRLDYLEGEPQADGVEISEARFVTISEALAREDVTMLSKVLIQSALKKDGLARDSYQPGKGAMQYEDYRLWM